MKIVIDSKIENLELWAVNEEVPKVTGTKTYKNNSEKLIHSFSQPYLLTDNARISKLPSVKRDQIILLQDFPQKIIEYDGVKIVYSNIKYPDVWSPSIDTILFARALHNLLKTDHYLNKIHSFLEIGCGSGFLSKYILEKQSKNRHSIKYAHLMDINRDALISAMDNIEEIKKETLISYSLNKPGKMIKVDRPYDLVLCNPPYIPRPNAETNNSFEGLFLYEEILRQTYQMLKPESRLITNFSSLSQADILPAFYKIFTIKKICSLKVPLKLPLLTARSSKESQKWMEYLEKNKKLIIDSKEKSGYRYWHEITIVECQLKT